jgi:hypothetical protein
LHERRLEIEGRFSKLPTSQEDLQFRKKALQQKIDSLDKEAFQQGVQVQSYFAIIAALQKWIDDNRGKSRWSPDDEKEFLARVQREYDTVAEFDKDLDEIRKQLAAEKQTVDTSVSGEDAIRVQYADLLKREHEVVASAEGRLVGDASETLRLAHQIRSQIQAMQARVDTAKGILRGEVAKKGQQMREKIRAEQGLLDGYGQQVVAVSADARQLVGRIAFDSFRHVYQQFYDLVLKADVGIVDVAFTRKQDNTQAIQKLAGQKDKELKQLDDEFKEVLKDVD